MDELISICIPTYRRPEHLLVAVRSCLVQTYAPIEVVVSDDSPDDVSSRAIGELAAGSGREIRYVHNVPRLGQNANVNRLFDLARGSRIVILHDDDVLLPDGIAALARAWAAYPGIALAFGKQQIINSAGDVLESESIQLNRTYYRVTERSGVFARPLEAALRQQIPNNGYLMAADAARRVRFRSEDQISVYCDIDFSLRLTAVLPPNSVVFVDEEVSQYRLSLDAISNNVALLRTEHPRAASQLYRMVGSMEIAAELEPARDVLLHRLVDRALKGFALAGCRGAALKAFFSGAYGWRRRLSTKGLYHLALIAFPNVDRLRKYK